MKRTNITALLIFFMSIMNTNSFAYNIAVENADGVTIYYNWINNQTELEVTSNSVRYTGAISIPSSVTYNGKTYSVTAIGNKAFYYCSGLTSVTIPSSVTSIGDYAFYYCSSLTSVTIPNSVTSIGDYAFYYCYSLTSVTIPNSVTSIGDYAFSNTHINSLTIGTGVLKIGNNALGSSMPAKTIWLTNTPPTGYTNAEGSINYVANDLYTSLSNKKVYPSLSSIFEVDGIKYVPVPSERTCDAIDCLYDETVENVRIDSIVSNQGIKLKVNYINPYTCYNNDYIKDVQLSNNGDIGNNAFQDCDAITNIDLTNSGSIGKYAFYFCSALKTANVQNKGLIDGSAFAMCRSLLNCTIGEDVTVINANAFYNCAKLQKIIIPNAVNSIGVSAFESCSSMQSAIIGNGAKTISSSAFSDCTSLTNIQIGNHVNAIGTYAFENCSALPKIEIPSSVTTIGDYTFSGCNSLATVLIANRESELKLGSNGNNPLFADCPLDSVYIGGDITYNTSSNSGYSPFYRNSSLRTIHITDKETEISPNEFYGCSGLKNVRIGDDVTTIGNWAFSGCSSLDYFEFGEKVETIGQEAFSDCVNMTKIISRASTPPTCKSQALDDINKWNCVLKVPVGSLTAYQNADQWKEFFFISEDANINVTGISLTPTAYTLVGIGSQIQLTVTIMPENATDKSVVWTSSNESVCKVVNGNVVAVGAGSATITATTEDGGFTAQCVVTVTIPVTGVSLNYSTYTLKGIGESVQLVATVLPNNAVNKSVVWTSSNESVCEVVNGNVVAVGAGSATITATTVDGGYTAQCVVTVTIPVTGVSLNYSTYTLKGIGESVQLVATVLPNNAVNKDVRWSTSDNSICEVDNGLVTATDIGTATITATTVDGGFKAQCTIIVEDNNPATKEGDANDDGFVDVTDIALIVNYILGRDVSNFNFSAADVNADGYIDVADFAGVANIILYSGQPNMMPLLKQSEQENNYRIIVDIPDVEIQKGEMAMIPFNMINDDNEVSSFQMDIHLPQGVSLMDVNMVENRRTNHNLDWVMVSQNVARVLYFSHNNSRIKGVNGPIICLSVIADDSIAEGSYAMSVEKIILTGDGDRITADNVSSILHVSNPNGIVGTQFDNNANHEYYSVDGYRMNKLRKGINIVRDRNGKTMKIVKFK